MTEQLQIPTAAGGFDAIAAGPEDGREVLLLHGFPEAGIEWEEQVAALGAAGCRAVAPDQRGYSPGVRPERIEDYAMAELVGDVLAMADRLGWQRFDLVGHDWGGAVAWVVAAEHPDRVRTLSVFSTPHPGAFRAALREDEDQQQRSQYMSVFRQPRTAERALLKDDAAALRRIYEWRVPPSRIEEYVQRLSEPGALTAALNWYRAARGPGTLEKVSVPTLYAWSTEDSAFGSTAAMDVENWVTGPYTFQLIEDVSHWVPEETPETVVALLLEHLVAHRG
ncbi:alpha/beta hydrolase [Solihabitans fulvus]|uniref:Alpha/beta hydrolase n=1 Tax=Solihabitans fulvus TaxID=1892852 RepID=A0A5B2WQI8_9PSEU|nr:alpha/beta hydrolase [Solihabitans fulvus]KAA2252982.1 alpha/beta hydrolase [Solihabitans fulvus]